MLGAVCAAGTLWTFGRSFDLDPAGMAWSLPFVGAYVAGLVAFRARPDDVAARRLLLFGLWATVWIGSSVLLADALPAHAESSWLGPANIALQVCGLAMQAAMMALLTIFPDGTYHRPYVRRIVVAWSVLAVALPLLLLVTHETLRPAWVFAWNDPGSPDGLPALMSPLYVPALRPLGVALSAYYQACLSLVPVIGVVLVRLRYRSLPAAARLQVRWPVFGLLLVLVAPAAELLKSLELLLGGVADAGAVLGLTALPASIAVAIVRPDLFDVDRVRRRSLVYVPLWIAVVGLYAGIAAALGGAASTVGVQLTIVLTIAVTVLAEPARRQLARRAARRADGETLSGEELMRRLGSTLAHTMQLRELAAEIAAVAREGLGATWSRVRLDDGVEECAGPAPEADVVPALSAPLVNAGEHLGWIECGPRARRAARPADRELLETLARQAGLAVHNARLAAELHDRLDELDASRARIVSAHESARRRIERDLHDGAQQELVALMARIGLARSQLGRDPGALDDTLVDLQGDVRQVLEDLRDLVAGIHPTVLSDHGLVAATEMRSGRLPIPVTVSCSPELRGRRFGDEVEGAAYFFVSEALTNVLKHARATSAGVGIACQDGELRVSVVDDGIGFSANGITTPGLRGLVDRIEAVGGRLTVDAAPGRGSRLTASLVLPDPGTSVPG